MYGNLDVCLGGHILPFVNLSFCPKLKKIKNIFFHLIKMAMVGTVKYTKFRHYKPLTNIDQLFLPTYLPLCPLNNYDSGYTMER